MDRDPLPLRKEMKTKTLRLISVLVLATMAAGCGFHLRGKAPLPENVSVVSVVGKNKELRAAVVDAMRVSGATVVDDIKQARAVLEMRDEKYERRVRTLDNRGKATSYRLFLTANYSLTGADGTALIKSRSISVARDFDFDVDQILAKENEERDLREEMIDDLTQQMLRQVNAAARRGSGPAPVPASTPEPAKGS